MTHTATQVAAMPPVHVGTIDVDIVVPVFNEERDLAQSVHRLHAYLRHEFPFTATITIADNASTDDTWPIATELAQHLDGVRAIRVAQKGRGRALHQTWSNSDARIVAYMDVDLSTDLRALSPLVAPLLSGHSDVAIGNRLARTSRVVRGPKREFISRTYNILLRTAMRARFSDAQCGFKAIRTECAKELLPHVEDGGWFFDTELLLLAQRSGLRIAEVPVDWVEDPDSRVDIVATAMADVRGMFRVAKALANGQLPIGDLRTRLGREPLGVAGVSESFVRQALRFAGIGLISTLAYLLLFVVLHPLGAQWANLLALLLTAVANTAANRRFTFGMRGGSQARHQAQGLLVFGLGLTVTSGSLWLLDHLVAAPARGLELTVLIAANLVATALRFVLFKEWVFKR
jgi:putative flippase GtrA